MARGSITPRGDAYRIAVELPPDQTGKRRQRFETFTGSRKEAERRLTELLTLLDGQRLGASPKTTLAQFLDRWLEDHAGSLAPKTAHRYRDIVHSYILPHLGNERLDKITPSHCVRLMTLLRGTDRKDGKGKLSAKSVLNAYVAFHVALESAVKWGLLPRNPLDGVARPKAQSKEMRTFDVEQAQRFLAASAQEALKWQAFLTLALTTGLRQSELRGVRWQDISLDAGQIHVQQTIQRVNGMGRIIKPPKTDSGRRPVMLDGDVVALLRRHRADQNAERLQMGQLWQDFGLVFASEIGTPLEDKRMRQYFHRICERAGVPKIRPYDLRHSCASLLLAAGVHPKVVAERLGHSSVNLTLSVYSHVLPTLQKDAAETLGRLLKQTR